MKTILLNYAYAILLAYIAVFFCFFYNYHLLYMEQLQVFRFSGLYFRSLVDKPGGLMDWAGGFVTQFFCLNHVGGLVLAGLLGILLGLQRVVLRRLGLERYSLAALLPVAAFAFYFMDVNAGLGALLGVLTALASAVAVLAVRNRRGRWVLFAGLLPALYWSCGAWSLVYAGIGMVAGLQPVWRRVSIKMTSWPVPGKRYAGWVQPGLLLLILAATVVGMQQRRNDSEETIYRLDYLMKRGAWDEMARVAARSSSRNAVFLAYTNLALLNTGKLTDRLLHFPQYPGVNEFWTPAYLPMYLTGELYYQLEMWHAARAYVFMANTQSPRGQSPVMYRRLAELEVVRGRPEAAMRYVTALGQTLFYRRWAREMEQAILSGNYPEDLQRKIDRYRPNGDFLAKELLYNVARKHEKDPGNRKVTEFLLAKYILANDYAGFLACLPQLRHAELPRLYHEFLLMYAYRRHDNSLLQHWNISRRTVEDFYNYLQVNQSGQPEEVIKARLQQSFGNTYWFYFQYNTNMQNDKNKTNSSP